MTSVVLLGAGNVASHLANVFMNAKGVELIQIYGRTSKSLKGIDSQINTTTNLNELAKADVYILTIPDDAISELSNQLNFNDRFVVHTSGSVAMNALNSKNRKGVFYPLQTFSKDKKVDFNALPICLEAQENDDLLLLEKLASAISNNIYFVDSKQRKSLHLAAVFVNNFVNHLYHIGHEICEERKVPFEILAPLIQETAKKMEFLSPFEAQTGPAKRNDAQTIKTQLAMLSKEHQKIYKLITQSIKETYGKKL